MLSSIASPRFDYTCLSPYPLTALNYKGSQYDHGSTETEKQLSERLEW